MVLDAIIVLAILITKTDNLQRGKHYYNQAIATGLNYGLRLCYIQKDLLLD